MSGPSSFRKKIQKESEKNFFSGGALPLPIPRGSGGQHFSPFFYLGHWAGSNELLHDAVALSDTLKILKIEIFQLWPLPTEGVGDKIKKKFFLAWADHPLSEKNTKKIRKNFFFRGHLPPPLSVKGVGAKIVPPIFLFGALSWF